VVEGQDVNAGVACKGSDSTSLRGNSSSNSAGKWII
jgi:hypothetical protein